jgi:hypothetical protein
MYAYRRLDHSATSGGSRDDSFSIGKDADPVYSEISGSHIVFPKDLDVYSRVILEDDCLGLFCGQADGFRPLSLL